MKRQAKTTAAQTSTERVPPTVSAGLALVVVGGAVVFDPWSYNGYLASKVLFVGIGLLILVVALARASALVVPAGVAAVSGSALVGLVVVTSAFSDSLWRSVLGAPLRHEGMLAWLGFAVAFVVGLSLRRRYGDAVVGSFVKVAVVAVLGVSAVGVLEFGGVEVDPDLLEFRGRVRSTFGNPAVLAGFVVLVGPLAAVATTRRDPWRWAGLAAVAGAVFNIAAAETRAVWLAAAALGVWVGLVRLRGRLRWLVVAAVLLALAGSLLTGRWQQVADDLGERTSIWEVAASVVVDDPLSGAGAEMFVVAFEEHVSGDKARGILGAAAVDRAHNGVLDFAVSYGALAGALYVAVLVLVGLLALRAVRDGDWFQSALGFGVAAYSLQQQALFSHPSTDVVWWMLAGILVADSAARPAADFGTAVRRLPRAGAVVIVAVLAVSVVNAGSLIRNDRLYAAGLESPSFRGAYEPLETAASHRPFDDLSYILMGRLLANTPDVSIVQRGIGQLREGVRLNPGNGLVVRALSDALLQAFRLTGDSSFASESIDNLSILIETQPNNGDNFLKRGTASYYLGDVESARSDWERAAFLMPERPEPRQNLEVVGEIEAEATTLR